MSVTDDHREENGVRPRVVLGHLFRHVFEGAVRVGAFAQVLDLIHLPDEVGLGGEGADLLLGLGVVQASDGPADLHLAPVVLIIQLLDKDLGELLDEPQKCSRWRHLQGDGL